MNDMTVGMENLPNVFINKITLNKKSYGYRYLVSVGLYDHKTKPSWKDKIHDLKIKIVFESRQNEISKLNEGSKSLQQYEVAPIGMNTQLTHEAYVINASSLVANRNEGDYDLYSYVLELDRIAYENLNVYAACFIDGLGFGIPMFDKFYGPMAAERIFVGGEINTISNYFYYPDTNEEYGGPVHQKPNGGYMEGSQHSDNPHKDVRLVSEENYKIQAQNFDVSNSMAGELSAYITGRYSREVSTLPSNAAETGIQQQTGLRSPTTYVTPTGVPTPSIQPNNVTIEDSNVPNSIPDRIY